MSQTRNQTTTRGQVTRQNKNGNRQAPPNGNNKPNGNNNIKIIKNINEPKEQDNPGITYDKQLNAIMLFGTKQERDVLKSIIEKIDIERQQVYVKAKILEINDDKASEIGLKYGIVGGLTNSSGLFALSNKMGLQDAGAAIGLMESLNLTLPKASNALALGAAVSLLSEASAADIISEPSILCINNEPSSLYVGKTVSVISQSSIGATTTDINKNNYKREDIGLTLNILPRISSDNKVTLGIEISSEDILPGSAIGLPQTTKRVVKTSAIVKNGETIIIGGMAREKVSKTVVGIPILRNIPLIGKLFSHDRITREKTTLVLMLTPYIIKQSGDLTKLREELGELYLLERGYGKIL
jgi:general secretion pathway protein D